MIKATKLNREFVIERNGKEIKVKDPNPNLKIDNVKKFLSITYPELINCRGHETKIEGETQIITFTTTFGPKG